MAKLIKAVFGAGQMSKTCPQWQYDYNTILQFVGLDLPATFEVDLANSKTDQSTTVLGDADGCCTIPAQYFIPGTSIYAWAYIVDGNSGYTRCQVEIPIHPRAQHTGDPPTPEQQSALDQAIALLNAATENIPNEINAALTEAKESGEFDGEPGDPGSNMWWCTLVPSNAVVQFQALNGKTDATPALHDYVFGPAPGTSGEPTTVYEIDQIQTSRAKLNRLGSTKGAPGEDGFAPEVTIEQITGGHRVTITSAAHPEGQSFDVMDGSGGGGVTVDDEISGTSENPVQNKVIKAALDGKLGTSGDGSNVTVAFTAATQRTAIATGEKLSVLFGKIRKWLSDLGTAAFRAATGSITQNSTDLVESGAVYTALAAKGTYSKPANGIPATDLESAVQTSLGKADTALQSYTETDPTVPLWAKAPNKPSYTASDVGAVAVSQGVAHAGEFVVVGSDGNITTVTMSVWQGGNYGS